MAMAMRGARRLLRVCRPARRLGETKRDRRARGAKTIGARDIPRDWRKSLHGQRQSEKNCRQPTMTHQNSRVEKSRAAMAQCD